MQKKEVDERCAAVALMAVSGVRKGRNWNKGGGAAEADKSIEPKHKNDMQVADATMKDDIIEDKGSERERSRRNVRYHMEAKKEGK